MNVTGTAALASVCLSEQPVFPFSPSAFHASLQTSIFRLRNRITGAAMSLLRKSDVKNHLSPRFRTELYLCPPKSQTHATSFPVAEPDATNTSLSAFAEDFIAEHSSPGKDLAPSDPATDSIGLRAHAISKSAQA
jgi:hypothetical protein